MKTNKGTSRTNTLRTPVDRIAPGMMQWAGRTKAARTREIHARDKMLEIHMNWVFSELGSLPFDEIPRGSVHGERDSRL